MAARLSISPPDTVYYDEVIPASGPNDFAISAKGHTVIYVPDMPVKLIGDAMAQWKAKYGVTDKD